MIRVIDASVALRWLLAEEAHPRATAVLERLVAAPTTFAVPELFLFEVHAVLVRLHPAADDAFENAVLPLVQSGVLRQPLTAALAAAAAPFVARGLTGYDSCYAGLATLLDGVWLTFDRKAHERIAASGVSVLVEEGLPDDW